MAEKRLIEQLEKRAYYDLHDYVDFYTNEDGEKGFVLKDFEKVDGQIFDGFELSAKGGKFKFPDRLKYIDMLEKRLSKNNNDDDKDLNVKFID